MKILEVFGEDYAALTFEQDLSKDTTKYSKLCEDNNGNYIDEDNGIEFELHWFGEVDPKFIDWVRNSYQDYDDSKHHNFYVVEE